MSLDLARDTIFLTLAGSRAHGTARPGSDVDVRGVCVAPLALRTSLFQAFEQHEGPLEGALWEALLPRLAAHPTAALGLDVKREHVVFDVAKFLRLCAAANPHALEALFADPGDWLLETPAWRRLHAERRRFLTRKVEQTFLGYALAQLKKIRTHRGWLLSPPDHAPRREEYGLPTSGTLGGDDRGRLEQAIADKVQAYGIDALEMPPALRHELQARLRALWVDQLSARDEDGVDDGLRAVAASALRLPGPVTAALDAERRYRSAQRHWASFETWKAERNPARAELERRHGYDTKHAMHLLRLLQMGLELLETGELSVRRLDAEALVAVREGALSFDALLAQVEALRERMARAAAGSSLPAELDHDAVDALAFELIRGGRER